MATLEMEHESPVFMGTDGAICHAACWRPLEYHGVRGGLSVDLYCPGCVEHVTLPIRHLPGIPMVRHALEAFAGLASYA
jgi:hypothetical protein